MQNLAERLHYNPITGELRWKDRPRSHFPTLRGYRGWQGRFSGRLALTCKTAQGYLAGIVDGKPWLAHRAAFALMTGYLPSEIDHINGNRSDNRWRNLRAVSRSENQRNCKIRDDNTSGFVGVSWLARKQRWIAYGRSGRNRIYLGYFREVEDAVDARLAWERSEGFHPNHGRHT